MSNGAPPPGFGSSIDAQVFMISQDLSSSLFMTNRSSSMTYSTEPQGPYMGSNVVWRQPVGYGRGSSSYGAFVPSYAGSSCSTGYCSQL